MALSPLDADRLRQAHSLAAEAIGLSDPNPRVGCVIGFEDGRVIGTGHTQAAGDAHAEVMALREAAAAGLTARGATAWVTLEPCAHHGRTPPCCDALVAAGITRVVVAAIDPFPAVNGQGLRRLRAAGIQVELGDEQQAAATREMNIGFFHRLPHGRPWVRLKVAVSLDGRTALPDGRSQWITGAEARQDVHAWRRRASAVVTGIGTVLADNPRLDVRLVPTALQPLRVVLDSRARLPPSANILSPPGRVLVVTARIAPGQNALRAAGAEVVVVEPDSGGNGIDLHRVLQLLAERQINELHVEAGARLNGQLLAAGLVDELLLYQAPLLIGPGLGLADLPALAALDVGQRFDLHDIQPIGGDVRLRLRPRRPPDHCRDF